MPHKLYSNGMVPPDFWESLKKRFDTKDVEIKEAEFYAGNKLALWIDLRIYPDNNIHGRGLLLNNTRDGVKIEIRRQTGGSGNITCHMFVVADALMGIMNSNLKSVIYQNRRRFMHFETKYRRSRKELSFFNEIMDELADKTPFHCIITAPTNGGKTRYLIDKLRGPFRNNFEYIVLICPTYAKNKIYRNFLKETEML